MELYKVAPENRFCLDVEVCPWPAMFSDKSAVYAGQKSKRTLCDAYQSRFAP